MSQGQQPRKPEDAAEAERDELDIEPEAITYGDVFNVSGSLAVQPITPQDAALMQSAEKNALGHSLKGGVAATMQAAAEMNEKAGLVNREEESIVSSQGMSISQVSLPGSKLTTEYVAGQPVRSDVEPTSTDYETASLSNVTIGEALEAAALKSGDKPVEASDAMAIHSAERRATGLLETVAGGIASAAQSAADVNARLPYDQKTTLGDLLANASEVIPADKAVTMEDARRIKEAEMKKSPTGQPFPGGVGEAMETAARINQRGGLYAPP
eukprot:Gb_18212 [translate_table: standard]